MRQKRPHGCVTVVAMIDYAGGHLLGGKPLAVVDCLAFFQ